jgi:serine/threonine protein kinase
MLTPEQILRLEETCDRFESAWQSPQPPRIEPFLDPAGEDRPYAAALFRELLVLDLTYRRQRNERPVLAEYVERFPTWASEIARVFGAEKPAGTRHDEWPARPPRYELVRCIGRGGLGEVWLARDHGVAVRRDTAREVAVKRIRPEWAGDGKVQQRFLREARITAKLNHPNIVPLYDLARDPVTEHPFFVLRLVHGKTLAEVIATYHEQRRAGKVDRLAFYRLLESFLDVCKALAHAHSHQVVHRDLKPSNVLVGEADEVMVLDWGLAKDLSEGADSATSAPGQVLIETPPAPLTTEAGATGAGTKLGTVPYMSPEQAGGAVEQWDARTDVYGLGAILFELLTGRPPREGSREQILGQIQAGPVRRPRVVEPRVPRPLEAVCLKAMAQQAADRYPSAQDLARDIERWLADEAVWAWVEPLPVQLGRWARRHRTLVASAAAALVAAATLVTAASLLLTAARHDTERSRAALRSEQAARAIAAFNLGVFHRDRGVSPEAESSVRQHLGTTTQLTVAEHRQRAKRQFHDAIALWTDLTRDYPNAVEYLEPLALCHVSLGAVHDSAGETAETEHSFRAALQVVDELVQARPRSESYRVRQGATASLLANWYMDRKRWADAEPLLHRAVAAWQQLVRGFPDNAEHRNELAADLSHLAACYRQSGRLVEMVPVYGRVVEVLHALAQQHPTNAVYISNLGQAQYNFAKATAGSGGDDNRRRGVELYAAAIGTFDRALVLPWPAANPDPRQRLLGHCHWNRAAALSELGRYAESLPDWDRAVALVTPEQRTEVRVNRAMALAGADQIDQAVSEAADLAAQATATRPRFGPWRASTSAAPSPPRRAVPVRVRRKGLTPTTSVRWNCCSLPGSTARRKTPHGPRRCKTRSMTRCAIAPNSKGCSKMPSGSAPSADYRGRRARNWSSGRVSATLLLAPWCTHEPGLPARQHAIPRFDESSRERLTSLPGGSPCSDSCAISSLVATAGGLGAGRLVGPFCWPASRSNRDNCWRPITSTPPPETTLTPVRPRRRGSPT